MRTPVSGSTLFTDAMALTPVGDGRYDGELNEHWTIGPRGSGPKVHGGAMLALCANAARMEHADDKTWPIAISGNFLWAPDPGPMRVTTTVRKRGRRVSLIDVELTQGERTALRAAVSRSGATSLASIEPLRSRISARLSGARLLVRGCSGALIDHSIVRCDETSIATSRRSQAAESVRSVVVMVCSSIGQL